MSKTIFRLTHGIIPACDVDDLDKFKAILETTSDIEGMVGYKIGCILGLSYGLRRLGEESKKYSDLPLIYDHQKAGTDIPALGEEFAKVCKSGGIQGVIVFPQSGPATEEAFIKAIVKEGLVPIVGGEMTHPEYLSKDGGYIRDEAPEEMYLNGAKAGATHFVLPGNKPDAIKKYRDLISQVVELPRFCMPGIGRQGGDIKQAFEGVGANPAYAIIGSGIYAQKNMRDAAKRFADIALSFE